MIKDWLKYSLNISDEIFDKIKITDIKVINDIYKFELTWIQDKCTKSTIISTFEENAQEVMDTFNYKFTE